MSRELTRAALAAVNRETGRYDAGDTLRAGEWGVGPGLALERQLKAFQKINLSDLRDYSEDANLVPVMETNKYVDTKGPMTFVYNYDGATVAFEMRLRWDTLAQSLKVSRSAMFVGSDGCIDREVALPATPTIGSYPQDLEWDTSHGFGSVADSVMDYVTDILFIGMSKIL